MRPLTGSQSQLSGDKNATFGQRRVPQSTNNITKASSRNTSVPSDAPMEISWVPSSEGGGDVEERQKSGSAKSRRKGVESFGAGLERGIEENADVGESERHGRTKRRMGGRSGSKNVFRRMDK